MGHLPSRTSKLKTVGESLTEEERAARLLESYRDMDEEVEDCEVFLRVYLKLQSHVNARIGSGAKISTAFLKAATMTLPHTISGSEKTSYVAHINNYLAEDQFLMRYLPIDPSTNDLFEIVKDCVLLCKLINVAVPGTTDE
uniref:Uncharacterized protein n=1 Tax=Nelumbo nucifera TaxID=4432 RepID=A0A822ZRS8_NELNU|nr:TPA_asm: hypothetical protein HUJ06_003866 [Nelumbo nucifera]